MIDELCEAWRTNCRVNHRILEAVSEEGLRCTLSTRGGRDVARQLAHLHDNRVMQLQRRAKRLGLGQDLVRFASKASPDRGAVEEALRASDAAMETFFRKIDAGEARSFRKGLPTYVAYLIAHESHHRGSIVLTLKQCGHPLARDLRDGLWDWDRI